MFKVLTSNFTKMWYNYVVYLNIYDATVTSLCICTTWKAVVCAFVLWPQKFFPSKRYIYFSIIINFPAIDNLSGAGDDV